MCPQSIAFFHPRTPDSIAKKDLILLQGLMGWPGGDIENVLELAEGAFSNSLLDIERKNELLVIAKHLSPWTRYEVYRAINNETNLIEKTSLCDEFLMKIKSLIDCVSSNDLSP